MPSSMQLPVLPSRWEWTTLGEVCEPPQYGWTTSAAIQGQVKLLRTTDITSGNIDWSSVPYCAESPGNIEKYLLNDGDIVISRAGSVGFSILVKNPKPAVFASYLIRFRPRPLIDEKYIAYYLQSPFYWESISENSLGIAIPNVNATKLKLICFPLAPLPEQQRIVAKIEELFTQLDAAESALKRAKANLKRYRQSVLQAAVTGELTREWREMHHGQIEPASELLKRIQAERQAKWEADLRLKGKKPAKEKYQEPTKPNKQNLHVLPEGWEWVTVSQIGKTNEQSVLTGPFGVTLGHEDFIESGVPVLTIGCLTDQSLSLAKAMYITEDKALELGKYWVKPGDLLFSRMASVGRAALVTSAFNGAVINYHLMRLRLAPDIILPDYFINFVRGAKVVNDYVREVNHGANRDGINTEQLLALPIALPPIDEQNEINIEVHAKFSQIEKSELLLNNAMTRINRVRQSILQRAFSGQLLQQEAATIDIPIENHLSERPCQPSLF